MKNISVLNSFDIKIIALITMIIDHIGYFFYYALSSDVYNVCRIIGRLSMPLFAFLIYQGFTHTSDFKKYLKRLMLLALITQLIVIGIGIFSSILVPQYNVIFYKELNIVFSFCLSLVLLKVIDKYVNIEKKSFKNTIVFSLVIISFAILYLILNIDYGLLVPAILVSMYIYDKYIGKCSRIFKMLYGIITIAIFLFIYHESLIKFSILAIIPMILYNGKKGDGNKYFFYCCYVIQFIVLYLLGIIMYI
ncbi:MAG: hypothetical protein J6A15_02015 [Clostridia bacterium]|nr:hypothetical protein [Clostridia bacterium]